MKLLIDQIARELTQRTLAPVGYLAFIAQECAAVQSGEDVVIVHQSQDLRDGSPIALPLAEARQRLAEMRQIFELVQQIQQSQLDRASAARDAYQQAHVGSDPFVPVTIPGDAWFK